MFFNRALAKIASRLPLGAVVGTPKDIDQLTRYAHRGLALDHTENTLEAFTASVEAGAQWIETDVNTTADGVVLIMHDPTLNRVAQRSGVVAQMTYAQIQEVTLPCGAKIPTLEEALRAFPEMPFNIDLKDTGSAQGIGQVLRRTGAWGRVRLASFSENRLLLARESLKEAGLREDDVRWGAAARSIALFYMVSHVAPGAWLRVQKLLGGVLSGFDALQVPRGYTVLGRRVPILTRKLLAAAHRYGYRVDVWTIDDAAVMKQLADVGVDGIVTNRVDVLTKLAL